jgi:hypothetical protein
MNVVRRLLLVPVILGVLLAGACIEVNVNDLDDRPTVRPSGDIRTVRYDYRDFSRVAVSDTFRATITQGGEFSVVLRVDANLLDHLGVTVDGDELEVELRGNQRLRGSFTMEAAITMPVLDAVQISGASQIEAGGFTGAGTIVAEVSGASRLEMTVVAEELEVDASGASRVTLHGKAESLVVDASGASTIAAEGLEANSCEVELSGASNAQVQAGRQLGPANLSGASKLTYLGSPELVEIDTSGASSVRAR